MNWQVNCRLGPIRLFASKRVPGTRHHPVIASSATDWSERASVWFSQQSWARDRHSMGFGTKPSYLQAASPYLRSIIPHVRLESKWINNGRPAVLSRPWLAFFDLISSSCIVLFLGYCSLFQALAGIFLKACRKGNRPLRQGLKLRREVQFSNPLRGIAVVTRRVSKGAIKTSGPRKSILLALPAAKS